MKYHLFICLSLIIFLLSSPINSTAEENNGKSDSTLKFNAPIVGIDMSTLINIEEIIKKIADKKIIYIGESHDRYEHHMVQLEIIKALYKKNKKVAVGMEMFQRPFQNALDDYKDGMINEKEFLKSSEYLKRWGFDYRYYRDIIEYAREKRMPIVALNVRKEISKKVFREGIDSLTEEEKKEIPEDMDLTNKEYKDYIKDIFEEHKVMDKKKFDFFYQAQIIWDETMAQTINEFLSLNPDYQMVVIAGTGHISFGWGIPERVFRRNNLDYAAIICGGEQIKKNVADYLVFPEAKELPIPPRLMVYLSVDNGKVTIKGFTRNSVSEKAGIKKGDIILSLDEMEVEIIDDVNIFLLYKKVGDTIRVKVSRKVYLLGGSEEIVLKVRL